MTALNVILGKDAAHVLTDGAMTAFGRMLSIEPKVLPVPHLGLVVATRGHGSVGRWVRYLAGRYRSPTELRERFPRDLRSFYGIPGRLAGRWRFEVVVAGVEDNRPFAFMLTNMKPARRGERAFTATEIKEFMIAPATADDMETAVSVLADYDNPRDRNALANAAIRLVDLQRSLNPHAIGGFAQLTTVNQYGIHTRIIKRWPEDMEKGRSW